MIVVLLLLAVHIYPVDHYALGQTRASKCEITPKLLSSSMTSSTEAYDCDVLIDQTYGRRTSEYVGLVTEVVQGPCWS